MRPRTITREQSRELDRRALAQFGLSGVVLMENAGRGVADVLERLGVAGPVVVACGKGNNAGDGFVLARHLDLRGHAVRLLVWAEPEELAGDAGTNFQIVRRSGIPMELFGVGHDAERLESHLADAAWIVDALLGTGARGEPRPPLDAVIDRLNAAAAPRLAIDLPSGLDCDTGQPARHTIRAAHTCTFVAPKPGFFAPGAEVYTGRVHVLDIGAPRVLVDEILGRYGATMSRPDEHAMTIRVVPREHVADALRLVYCRMEGEQAAHYVETLARGIHAGEIPGEGLREARRGGHRVGAIFSQAQPGRTAVVWPPQLAAGEPLETASQLLADTCTWLAAERVQVAHALLEKVDRPVDGLLRGAGFAPLATLLYLVSTEADFPPLRPTGTLEFDPYDPGDHHRMLRTVQATYENSLDCPALDGLRTMEDVLAGYRATGCFGPERWLVVRQGGQDVGCLLLADHPQDQHWELVYMGLVPSARGHGWGREIVRYGQWLTGQAGRPRLVVAVDAANRPALDMYAIEGFRAWDRRRVYVKALMP